ncbi:cytidine/deoxycytidylate deaminase family protein [Streptomyces chartreusis]|uniref:hypothetical protein n=1 Tax=Streptomyces chartreusis TaxID=1969 RepID=UPI00368F4505
MSGIKLAIKQAARSQCRHRVGAVLTAGSRVLVASPNLHRNSPTIDYRHATFHAEEATLRRIRNPRRTVIYVARLSARGLPTLAKPCDRCEEALRLAGVSRAYYTAGPARVEYLDI